MDGALLQNLKNPSPSLRLDAIKDLHRELLEKGGRATLPSSELNNLFHILSERFSDDDKGGMTGQCMLITNRIISDFGHEVDSHFDILFPPLVHTLGNR
jgi:hypothetical protein